MIESLIATLHAFMNAYGAVGVFCASVVEEIIALVPSSVIQVGAGFFMLDGAEHSLESFMTLLFVVAIPVGIGATLGSLFLYWIGYVFGKPAIDRFGKFFGVNWTLIEKMQAFFKKRSADEFGLYIARATPVIPNTPIGIVCGVIRMPLRTFIPVSIAGATTRAFIQGYIGWRIGSLYLAYAMKISHYEQTIMIGLAAILVIGIIAYLVYKRRGGKRDSTQLVK